MTDDSQLSTVSSLIRLGEPPFGFKNGMPGIRLSHWLTRETLERRINSFADTASRAVATGWQVDVEGLDWQSTCHDHGFYGAIAAVKARAALRLSTP